MKRWIIALCALPVVAYPLVAGALFVADAVVGERLVLFLVEHEQRLLWDTFWHDYRASLPVFYVVIGGAAGLFMAVRGVAPARSPSPWVLVPTFAVVAWGLIWFALGDPTGPGHVAAAAAAAVLGTLVATCLSKISNHSITASEVRDTS